MAAKGQLIMDPSIIDDGLVRLSGETHVLNYDTNILNLEENRDVSPGVDVDAENDVPVTTGTDSDSETEEDVEVHVDLGTKQQQIYYKTLSILPYLLILNASHNKLTTVLDFTPPRNLKEVDLSYNSIAVMADLSAHHSLAKLNLDFLNINECQVWTNVPASST
ncbi:hypothetical protein DPMN_120986 [Dreissena polymorpha]|uniref:Uncharacterized protein n=1 Tax=Dreissena polymorpha TaxID=45954 RepID=A0A9D4GLX5_DREPO|nr:hypothetical protein DPMN_120986 [Dreissena polymorpha]